MRNGALIPVTDPSSTAIDLRDRTRPRRRRQRTPVDPCDEAGRRSAPAFTAGPGRSSMRTAPRCPAPAARRGAGRRRRSFVDDSRAILVRSTAARGSAAACARGHDQRGAVPPVCTARDPRVPPALSGRGAEPDGHTPPLLAREALDDGMDVALSAFRWCRLRCSRPARKVQATSRCRRCAPRRGCACCAAPASSRVCR